MRTREGNPDYQPEQTYGKPLSAAERRERESEAAYMCAMVPDADEGDCATCGAGLIFGSCSQPTCPTLGGAE